MEKERTSNVYTMRMNPKKDSDILEYVKGKTFQVEIKRLVRLGMEKEKKNGKKI